ncbi:mechanosensitive ion channel family protein [Sansalvadorimonas sp. 2012CJ34-2]|uniref:Mechanosensitive ion channel family protein n=1 Tax=Parendozoicomonas callyspongiae TaxID=2942213 RepID=A0ABT0PF17_9GAMM|nr:mechanosensitive ion channel family protein [Sansalvadorimonas sp. 2012CJ34-2]MCL6269806.1 mechanosensitive ion channel family protein [Sansalvadorimonas sp. 2012CJ34-2]
MELFESLKNWLIQQNSWVFQVFLVLLLAAMVHLFVHLVSNRLEKGFAKTRNLWDDALLHAARKPVLALVWLAGLLWVMDILRQVSGAPIINGLTAINDLVVVIVVSWFFIRFIRRVERQVIAKPVEATGRIDTTTAMAISKLLRAVVIITTILVVLQTMGYSLSGVLAFGGIGGIAVGFAAKDMLANFFGGMMIYFDRPFSVGDWIRSPDKNIEGTVEYIGWRQTRIRTFDKRPLYVPNATFSNISVENPSRMQNRRIKETVGLRYSDAARLPEILEDVRSYLKNSPAIDHSKILMVNFNTYGPSSLDFFIYCFTKTCDWSQFHIEKEQVLLDVLAIIHRHGADVAYPTQTINLPEAPLFDQPDK